VLLNTYIGGVKVFLGPALGASLMTFFGYAVSDLTQSWLLYQGILFLLVMMFMPDGLAGMVAIWRGLARRFGAVQLLPMLLAALLASVLVSAGTAFLVELLQRIFSQDYRALAAASASGAWPPVSLGGARWSPGSLSTWAVPAGLFAAGGLLAWGARVAYMRLQDRGADEAVTNGAGLTTARSVA